MTAGGIIVVNFTYDVPALSTLNVNNTGAKSIYHKGALLTAGIIKGDDIATFIYDGTEYILMSVDRRNNGVELGISNNQYGYYDAS